jgi:hypothetical protein
MGLSASRRGSRGFKGLCTSSAAHQAEAWVPPIQSGGHDGEEPSHPRPWVLHPPDILNAAVVQTGLLCRNDLGRPASPSTSLPLRRHGATTRPLLLFELTDPMQQFHHRRCGRGAGASWEQLSQAVEGGFCV